MIAIKNRVVYRCPQSGRCELKKRCTAITVPRPLKEPIQIWIKCLLVKRHTGGDEKEILVTVTEDEIEE